MNNARLIISVVIMLILVIFIIQNTAVMEFRLFFWTVAMSRALMLFLLLGIGLGIGWFLHSHFASRKQR
jgi:uncharacterized integral membrane protein